LGKPGENGQGIGRCQRIAPDTKQRSPSQCQENPGHIPNWKQRKQPEAMDFHLRWDAYYFGFPPVSDLLACSFRRGRH
jgi:hypothetical protein